MPPAAVFGHSADPGPQGPSQVPQAYRHHASLQTPTHGCAHTHKQSRSTPDSNISPAASWDFPGPSRHQILMWSHPCPENHIHTHTDIPSFQVPSPHHPAPPSPAVTLVTHASCTSCCTMNTHGLPDLHSAPTSSFQVIFQNHTTKRAVAVSHEDPPQSKCFVSDETITA